MIELIQFHTLQSPFSSGYEPGTAHLPTVLLLCLYYYYYVVLQQSWTLLRRRSRPSSTNANTVEYSCSRPTTILSGQPLSLISYGPTVRGKLSRDKKQLLLPQVHVLLDLHDTYDLDAMLDATPSSMLSPMLSTTRIPKSIYSNST